VDYLVCGLFSLDVFHNVPQFVNRDIFQSFSLAIQVFVDFDGGFLHDSVSFLRAPSEEKVGAAGYSLLPIFGIESQAE
jgi:hypothetical protein